jgi:hypothetical protein
MDNPVSEDTEQGIRALCDEIAVAHDIDPELREELRGHVEDKMLGYLSGEEAVSEADAFILAREHFGDRARLKAMLSDVHHIEADVSLWRRVAAGLIVVLFVGYASIIALGLALCVAMKVIVPVWPGERLDAGAAAFIVTLAGASVLAWRLLAQLKSHQWDDETAWFVRWSRYRIAFVLVALVACRPLFVTVFWTLQRASTGSRALLFPRWVGVFWPDAVVVAMGFLLLWACATPRRRVRGAFAATGAWAGLVWVNVVIGKWLIYTPASWPCSNNDLPGVLHLQIGELVWHAYRPGLWVLRTAPRALALAAASLAAYFLWTQCVRACVAWRRDLAAGLRGARELKGRLQATR